jgi:ribosomal protein L22
MYTSDQFRNIINILQKIDTRKTLNESTSKRHPIPDHDYHKKSDSQLRYILKDASEAATAMKNHDTKAELKYLDQVNDASTVLAWRKKHGMPDWYCEKYNHKQKKDS